MQRYCALGNTQLCCNLFGCFTQAHQIEHSKLHRRKIDGLQRSFNLTNGSDIAASPPSRAVHHLLPPSEPHRAEVGAATLTHRNSDRPLAASHNLDAVIAFSISGRSERFWSVAFKPRVPITSSCAIAIASSPRSGDTRTSGS